MKINGDEYVGSVVNRLTENLADDLIHKRDDLILTEISKVLGAEWHPDDLRGGRLEWLIYPDGDEEVKLDGKTLILFKPHTIKRDSENNVKLSQQYGIPG
jgi:hypothetical protein